MATSDIETVHISLGVAANHLTAHLLNLQGLAATTSPRHQDESGEDGALRGQSLCDPLVTHDVAPIDPDCYSSHAAVHASTGYMYVPRVLIVDGRDAFGTPWGGVSRNGDSGDCAGIHRLSSTFASLSLSPDNPSPHIPAWNGNVKNFNASEHGILFGERPPRRMEMDGGEGCDPVREFRRAASALGLDPLHSRFGATPPSSSHNVGRHIQWGEKDGKEEEFDDYCYGQDETRAQEEKRRQLERMERRKREARSEWNTRMNDAWEEAFYGGDGGKMGGLRVDDAVATAPDVKAAESGFGGGPDDATAGVASAAGDGAMTEREIHWYDYWMPPRPSPRRYQVPLPFDVAASSTNLDSWSDFFVMGYRPGIGGSLGRNDLAGITQSWREDTLSESLRKVLEGCDIVKGFNVFVDGGSGHFCESLTDDCSPVTLNRLAKKRAEGNLPSVTAGGGFHAGLATSLLEELSEECRSAALWVVMADPLDAIVGAGSGGSRRFRRLLNAGLALHGLSSNANAFLPVSIDGGHVALRGSGGNGQSPNRVLFEGSAAVSLALEASTLPYRLRRRHSSSSSFGPRGRVGIQSGFYQGYGGGGTRHEDLDDLDDGPYAVVESLTYHEFLMCNHPLSDGRRSVLEIDALLQPLSRPLTGPEVSADGAMAPGGALMASLAASGMISGGDSIGGLQERLTRGTTIERMRMERQRQQRSSSGRYSSRLTEPGEWLEDFSTRSKAGLLYSLSGNAAPFGRRSDHRHFALSASLRPATSDPCPSRANFVPGSGRWVSTFLRPMMESIGVGHRPEVGLGTVVEESVGDLMGTSSYWRSIFADRTQSVAPTRSYTGASGNSSIRNHCHDASPKDIVSQTSILSVLGNSTRSYPRLSSISSGFCDALRSSRNLGYLSRDVAAGIMPEGDDCEEALEYCWELVDTYEPPAGSGLLIGGNENEDPDSYFDEE